ncbi:MAG: hypothetical protein LBH25_02045 [Fibromonadaceae bacterium]|jgi:hypothetical protein|nr:hypothetical protein [Fibromonadaceae bacterium]
MKKWFCFLLAFGFMSAPVWAQDDEYEDDEYEEEAPKKGAKKADAAKKAKSAVAGSSRMGFAVEFIGNQDIGFVYDMGSGMEIFVGLGLSRTSFAEVNGATADPVQEITGILGISYSLGKGLLDYGLGANAVIVNKGDAGNDMGGFVFFYTKADLLQNVSLKLSAGANVEMPALPDPVPVGSKSMQIDLGTSVGLIFYFM